MLAAAAGLGGGYGWGLRRRRAHHDDRWPVGRAVVFFAGVATIVLVGCSFLGVYDDAYFWVRAVQNTVLLMVTPMLLALASRSGWPPTRSRPACARRSPGPCTAGWRGR